MKDRLVQVKGEQKAVQLRVNDHEGFLEKIGPESADLIASLNETLSMLTEEVS